MKKVLWFSFFFAFKNPSTYGITLIRFDTIFLQKIIKKPFLIDFRYA